MDAEVERDNLQLLPSAKKREECVVSIAGVIKRKGGVKLTEEESSLCACSDEGFADIISARKGCFESGNGRSTRHSKLTKRYMDRHPD